MEIAPSPTADATRVTLPARTSPTANTSGRLVSSICGVRFSGHCELPSAASRSRRVRMDIRQCGFYCAIPPHQIRNIGPNRTPDKHVAQFAHNAFNSAVVNVDICPSKITDRLENAIRIRIAHEPGMPTRIHTASTNC